MRQGCALRFKQGAKLRSAGIVRYPLEAMALIVRSVPGDVRVRGKPQWFGGMPRDGVAKQRGSDALSHAAGTHGKLIDVRLAIDNAKGDEPDRLIGAVDCDLDLPLPDGPFPAGSFGDDEGMAPFRKQG